MQVFSVPQWGHTNTRAQVPFGGEGLLEDLQCVFTLMVQDISSRRLGLVFSQALGLWTDKGLETGGETGLLDYCGDWKSGDRCSVSGGLTLRGAIWFPGLTLQLFPQFLLSIYPRFTLNWQSPHSGSLIILSVASILVPTEIINEKQYCITTEIVEIHGTVKDLKQGW